MQLMEMSRFTDWLEMASEMRDVWPQDAAGSAE